MFRSLSTGGERKGEREQLYSVFLFDAQIEREIIVIPLTSTLELHLPLFSVLYLPLLQAEAHSRVPYVLFLVLYSLLLRLRLP